MKAILGGLDTSDKLSDNDRQNVGQGGCMAKNKQRARQISQAQKQRHQEKADLSPSPAASRPVEIEAPVIPAPRTLERKVTFRLDAARFDQLEDYARREGFTVSVIVRHLVCRFLEDQRRFLERREQ
jgi:NRPS condensation-like uncharacterized protein